MSQRVFTNEIVNHIMTLCETNLQGSLSLSGVFKGHLEWFPTQSVLDMVPGIWIAADPIVKFERIELPKVLQATYFLRTVFIKKIEIGVNVNEQSAEDARTIVEMYLDNYYLANLSLTNGDVLWHHVSQIEFDPPEDAYVAQTANDLIAIAIRHEVVVRTRNQ